MEYKPQSIWLVGDYYSAWIAIKKSSQIDNDPEHQPDNIAVDRRPLLHYLPSGAWHVKRFVDGLFAADGCLPSNVVESLDDTTYDEHVIFGESKPFLKGSSTVSYVLDKYAEHPDCVLDIDEEVYRVCSHNGYYSEWKTLLQQYENAIELEQKTDGVASRSHFLGEQKTYFLQKIIDHEKQLVAKIDRFVKRMEGVLPDVLLIEDMDMGFRDCADSAITSILTLSRSSDNKRPIIVLLGRSLPNWQTTDPHKDGNHNGLWNTLLSYADQVTVVVNADLLRYTGADISRRVSWERTAQDCVNAFNNKKDRMLEPLCRFRNIVVRFGVAAAIHLYKDEDNNQRANLYYDTKSHDGSFRDVNKEGGVVGNNSMYAAYLAKHLALEIAGINDDHRSPIGCAISNAIPACQRLFRLGYGGKPLVKALDNLVAWNWPPAAVFSEDSYKEKKHRGFAATHSRLIDEVAIPDFDPSKYWAIATAKGLSHDDLSSIAYGIVRKGVRKVINNPDANQGKPFLVPIASFGKLQTLDRKEIENFRALSNIVRQYLVTLSQDPLAGPMSVAVFGAPGSGKSYTVKEIVKAIDPMIARNYFEINVAQLTSQDELASNLLRVNEVISVGETPLVFFDEFDSKLGETSLGWLKYFLAPMEGGTFKHVDEGIFRLSRGIFVFAGGTSATREEFISDNCGKEYYPSSKCRDFLSRLRCYFDVRGINEVHSKEVDHLDELYILRRAMMLRSLLERNGLVDDHTKLAQVDGSLLYALLELPSKNEGAESLRVPAYHYDTRSLRTVVSSCLRLHGRIEKASLPPPHILDMHVNANDLAQLMIDNIKYRNTSVDNHYS